MCRYMFGCIAAQHGTYRGALYALGRLSGYIASILCCLCDRNGQALALREVQGNRQGLASDQFLVGAQSLQGVLRGTHR